MQDARREALAARLHKERMALWDQDLNRVTKYLVSLLLPGRPSRRTTCTCSMDFTYAHRSGAALLAFQIDQ